MGYCRISSPVADDDHQGAQRCFEEFLEHYQPVFIGVDHHLEEMIENIEAPYASAYQPWQEMLKDLFQGIYLIARRIPLPDPERFLDALNTFSFEGSAQFLSDICLSRRMALPPNWIQTFREHIQLLLFSFSIIMRNQKQERELAR